MENITLITDNYYNIVCMLVWFSAHIMNASNNERVTINCGPFQRMFYLCRIAYVLLVGYVDAYENTPTYGLVSVSYYVSRCGKLPCVDRVYPFSGKNTSLSHFIIYGQSDSIDM